MQIKTFLLNLTKIFGRNYQDNSRINIEMKRNYNNQNILKRTKSEDSISDSSTQVHKKTQKWNILHIYMQFVFFTQKSIVDIPLHLL